MAQQFPSSRSGPEPIAQQLLSMAQQEAMEQQFQEPLSQQLRSRLPEEPTAWQPPCNYQQEPIAGEPLSQQLRSRLHEEPTARQPPYTSQQEPLARQRVSNVERESIAQQSAYSRSQHLATGRTPMNQTSARPRNDVVHQPYLQRSSSQPTVRASPPSVNSRPQVRASPPSVSSRPQVRPSPPSSRASVHLETSSLDGGSSTCSSATPARAEGSAALQELVAAARQMAAKLGGGHPTVQRAREKIRQLRAGEAEFRASSSAQCHFENIESACEDVCAGAELAKLDSALKLARCSDLGRNHVVVKHGAAKATQVRRQMFLEAMTDVESQHDQMMRLAAEGGDRDALGAALNVGVGALGYNNAYIEDARKSYRQQRNSWQRQDWESLVGAHAEAMEHACELGDPELFEACIQAAMKSELGTGHALVLEGKKYLLQLRKNIRRQREDSRLDDYEQVFRRLSLEAEFDLEARRDELSRVERQAPAAPKGARVQRAGAKTWRESLR